MKKKSNLVKIRIRKSRENLTVKAIPLKLRIQNLNNGETEW